MKLFLASYRMGAHAAEFEALVGRGARIAVVAAAVDGWSASARRSAVTSELTPLRAAGYSAEEVDIRRYHNDPDRLETEFRKFDCIWVRGGNTFVLRAQLAATGADHVIDRLVRSGALVYAGYSAGACVAGPTLIGLDATDDPAEVTGCGNPAPNWSGLGFIDFALVPHGHGSVLEDPTAVAATARQLEAAAVPFVVVSDDQVVIADAGEPSLI